MATLDEGVRVCLPLLCQGEIYVLGGVGGYFYLYLVY